MTLFSSSIRENTFVFFDTETTGLHPLYDDRIIEVAFIKVKSGSLIDKYTTLINPHRKIPPEASNINNIYDYDVENMPFFDHDISLKIVDFIKDAILVAHNAEFDINFLSKEFSINGITFTDFRYIDTLKIGRFLSNRNEKNKLQDWISRYNIQANGALHRALEDTDCLYKVFFNQIEEPQIRSLQIDEIIEKFGKKVTYENMVNNVGSNIVKLFGKRVGINYSNRNGDKVYLKIVLNGPVWNSGNWFLSGYFQDKKTCFLDPKSIISIDELI